MLHGGQNGRGWTLVVAEATGAMSATVAEDQGAFVISGACLAP